MARCIYSGADESTAAFSSAEHIFPKCIGGIDCLPRGWVADSVNQAFSPLELSFARTIPMIAVNRMFSQPTGRLKHKNREQIGVFETLGGETAYSLGYIIDSQPIPLRQLSLTAAMLEAAEPPFEVRLILTPDEKLSKQEQLREFTQKLRDYAAMPVIIQSGGLPPQTCLLGERDGRWYLGVNNTENVEELLPKLHAYIRRISAINKDIPKPGQAEARKNQVNVDYSFTMNADVYYRVCAKIAFNCLALLRGRDFVLAGEFDGIRRAILTGEGIERYVNTLEAPNVLSEILKRLPHCPSLGLRYHSVLLISKDSSLYGLVALYGAENPVAIRFGAAPKAGVCDFYLCDWENKKTYTMEQLAFAACSIL